MFCWFQISLPLRTSTLRLQVFRIKADSFLPVVLECLESGANTILGPGGYGIKRAPRPLSLLLDRPKSPCAPKNLQLQLVPFSNAVFQPCQCKIKDTYNESKTCYVSKFPVANPRDPFRILRWFGAPRAHGAPELQDGLHGSI